MGTNELNKNETLTRLFALTGFRNIQKGTEYLHGITLKAWKEWNTDWQTYDEYIEILASEINETQSKIKIRIAQTIKSAWKQGDKTVLQSIFGGKPDNDNIPTYILLMRTFLSLLFYGDENKVDIPLIIERIKKSEYDTSEDALRIMAGYIILILKANGITEPEIDKAAFGIDDILKTKNMGEALFAYVKYKSEMFADITITDVVIPPEYQNIDVFALDYENDRMGVYTGNALYRAGIQKLKDLRFKSDDELHKIKGFGDKAYACFIAAIKRTIEKESYVGL